MKKNLTSLVILIVLFLSACSAGNEAPQIIADNGEPKVTQPPGESPRPDEVLPSNGISEPTATPASADDFEVLAYFESWQVESVIDIQNIQALSPEETAEYIGSVITYAPDHCFWQDSISFSPSYHEETVSADNFELNYPGVTLAELGINGDEARIVTVDGFDGFGTHTILINQNELAIVQDGVFFKAKRLEGNSMGTPVKAAIQLYEGTFFDERVYGMLDQPQKDLPTMTMYEIRISGISDESFDFAIYEAANDADQSKPNAQAVLSGSAHFTGNGTAAQYGDGAQTISFLFPNRHGAYPVITAIEVIGLEPLKGVSFINNSVPGHEVG